MVTPEKLSFWVQDTETTLLNSPPKNSSERLGGKGVGAVALTMMVASEGLKSINNKVIETTIIRHSKIRRKNGLYAVLTTTLLPPSNRTRVCSRENWCNFDTTLPLIGRPDRGRLQEIG